MKQLATKPASDEMTTKKIQENLNKWDDLCELSEEQLTSVKKLQKFNQYQIDDDLSGSISDLNLDNNNSGSDTFFYKKMESTNADDLGNLDRVGFSFQFYGIFN